MAKALVKYETRPATTLHVTVIEGVAKAVGGVRLFDVPDELVAELAKAKQELELAEKRIINHLYDTKQVQ